jgi:hypothetical protein
MSASALFSRSRSTYLALALILLAAILWILIGRRTPDPGPEESIPQPPVEQEPARIVSRDSLFVPESPESLATDQEPEVSALPIPRPDEGLGRLKEQPSQEIQTAPQCRPSGSRLASILERLSAGDPAPQPAESGRFVVYFGAFRHPDYAQFRLRSLQDAGIAKSALHLERGPSERIQRVAVGYFSSRSDAEFFAISLARSHPRFDEFWVSTRRTE